MGTRVISWVLPAAQDAAGSIGASMDAGDVETGGPSADQFRASLNSLHDAIQAFTGGRSAAGDVRECAEVAMITGRTFVLEIIGQCAQVARDRLIQRLSGAMWGAAGGAN
jgi:hypothetical protein